MHFRTFHYILLLAVTLLLASACTRKQSHVKTDSRLRQVKTLLDTHADSLNVVSITLQTLYSINPQSLQEQDRHLYNLLLIKATDKLSLPLESDSAIEKAVLFYSKQQDNPLYPQALYYAGRSASENNNPNKALNFYKMALNECDNPSIEFNDIDRYDLKGRILSNIASCMFKKRKFKESRKYLKASILIDSITEDSIGLMLDLKQMGIAFLKNEILDSARFYLKHSRELALKYMPAFRHVVDIYYAEALYKENNIEEAMNIVRPLPSQIDSIALNTALSLAAQIYLRAGSVDTAFLYAKTLALSDNPLNRHNGYHLITSPALRNLIPDDSLRFWLAGYNESMEEYLSTVDDMNMDNRNDLDNNVQFDINGLYRPYKGVLILCLIITFILGAAIAYFWQRSRVRKLIRHCESLKTNLNKILENTTAGAQLREKSERNNGKSSFTKDEILNQLKDIANKTNRSYTPPASLTNSTPLRLIRNRIDEQKAVPTDNNFWEELKEVVTMQYPDFLNTISLLSGDNISDRDIRLVLLIKCGVTPSQLCILFSKEKGTISHYRKNLCQALFGNSVTLNEMDHIIHCI